MKKVFLPVVVHKENLGLTQWTGTLRTRIPAYDPKQVNISQATKVRAEQR